MATTSPEVKANGRSHRQLVDAAIMLYAEAEIRKQTNLTMSRALARGLRRLAQDMRLDRRTVSRMREVDRVRPCYWPVFEAITDGRVTAAEFERAAHE